MVAKWGDMVAKRGGMVAQWGDIVAKQGKIVAKWGDIAAKWEILSEIMYIKELLRTQNNFILFIFTCFNALCHFFTFSDHNEIPFFLRRPNLRTNIFQTLKGDF